MAEQKLPNYVASATPLPKDKRVGWLTSTAASYAGVMLWFVFWQDVPSGGGSFIGGTLAEGMGFGILALVLSAAICYSLYYLVPGMLGMKTGLPLSIVGTSTYGVNGGFFMPGFLMGLLQFGWLAVNAYFAGLLLAGSFGGAQNSSLHFTLSLIWAIGAGWIGLAGIKYVGRFASYMPILPLFVLGFLLVKTLPHLSAFKPESIMELAPVKTEGSVSLYGSQTLGVLSLMGAYVVGFFATAGAAGCDFGMNNKDKKAVQWGGLVGVFGSTVLTGVAAILIICGAYAMPEFQEAAKTAASNAKAVNPVELMGAIVGPGMQKILLFLLVIAAFPSACFSTLIAANSFKATLPKVNPYISCGLGVLGACVLIITTWAGNAGQVFTVIGASFGPVCGSMMADYFLSGCKWAGPRAGFNPAGWLAWIFGFAVGSITLLSTAFNFTLPFVVPCPPVSAFLTGLVLYFIFAGIGLQSRVLNMPQRIDLEK
ncbi:MAG: cytosine permease [Planctomycetia bacterium]|nr:cytosine permease [Planctomycetia bacterium]